MAVNINIKNTHIALNDDQVPVQIFFGKSDFCIILYPPDPDWPGGNMFAPVINAIFNECRRKNISCLRMSFLKYKIFNNNYSKYISQASMCIEELFQEVGNNKKIWVVGYSFGALLSLNIALRRPEVNGFVMICPPLLHYNFLDWLDQCQIRGMVVYGTKDDLSSDSLIKEYISCLMRKKMYVKSLPVFGANHMLSGKENLVASEVINFIQNEYELSITNEK